MAISLLLVSIQSMGEHRQNRSHQSLIIRLLKKTYHHLCLILLGTSCQGQHMTQAHEYPPGISQMGHWDQRGLLVILVSIFDKIMFSFLG